MFSRILKKMGEMPASKAIEQTIFEANAFFDEKRKKPDQSEDPTHYYDAFNLYKEVVAYITSFSRSKKLSSELLWCKSQMQLCQRLTSTVPVHLAMLNLIQLENEVAAHATSIRIDIKQRILSIADTARKYYADQRSRADANYCFAVNFNLYLTTPDEHKVMGMLIELPTAPDEKITFFKKAIQALTLAVNTYHNQSLRNEHAAALDILAAIHEHFADFCVDLSKKPGIMDFKIRFLNIAAEHYENAIACFKKLNVSVVDLFLSRLYVFEQLMQIAPQQQETYRQLLARYIRENINDDLFNELPPLKRGTKLAEFNAYKEIAGLKITSAAKRPGEQMQEQLHGAPALKKVKLDPSVIFFRSEAAAEETTLDAKLTPATSPTK